MDWIQFAVFLVTMLGVFFWFRAESRADTRMMLGMIDAIQKEIKDFHGRLCAIEERNKEKR